MNDISKQAGNPKTHLTRRVLIGIPVAAILLMPPSLFFYPACARLAHDLRQGWVSEGQ
jgi:hypothetical protein